MDIGDKNSVPPRAVEVKSYESGVVYATVDITNEAAGDAYLVDSYDWSIEWVFIGCRPSGPLETLLENANIKITLIP